MSFPQTEDSIWRYGKLNVDARKELSEFVLRCERISDMVSGLESRRRVCLPTENTLSQKMK